MKKRSYLGMIPAKGPFKIQNFDMEKKGFQFI